MALRHTAAARALHVFLQPTRSTRAARRPAVEPLESRRLLAAVTWDGGGDGVSWGIALNWNPNRVPGPADDVTISAPGELTILVSNDTGTAFANSVLLKRPLQFTGGSLSIGGAMRLETGGSLAVDGGRVETGRLELTDTTTATVNGGNLAAVELEVLSGGTLTLNSAATFGNGHVASGGVVTHTPGDDGFAMNVNGNLAIDAGGAIDVKGRGFRATEGPGGSPNHTVGFESRGAGGAGHGAAGGTSDFNGGIPYGDATSPGTLGSGGGSITRNDDAVWGHGDFADGGAGGGRISVDVGGRLTVDGSISADGVGGAGNNSFPGLGVGLEGGGGSGGSILIRADVFAGHGIVSAAGGNGGVSADGRGGGGGGGRIAVAYRAYDFDAGHFNVAGGQGRQNGSLGSLRPVELPPLAPAVTGVFVSGSAWTFDFKRYLAAEGLGDAQDGLAVPAADQLNELPWVNLDRVSVRFSTNTVVDANDLRIRGSKVANYAVDPASFGYNPLTRTATWTLSGGQVFGNERVIIDLDADAPDGAKTASGTALDGEWVNPVGAAGDQFPSGDGNPGGDFRFRFNILPGDADRSGSVLANDYSAVKARFFKNTTSLVTGTNDYSPFHDVDGSGSILANDYSAVKGRFFNTLPGGEPTAALRGDALRVPLRPRRLGLL